MSKEKIMFALAAGAAAYFVADYVGKADFSADYSESTKTALKVAAAAAGVLLVGRFMH